MTNRSPRRKSELDRAARWAGTLVISLVWGLVELVALQRLRYHAWRDRVHSDTLHS